MRRNKVIPAVFLIVKKANKILLLERSNTGWNDGMFTLPSGHVEKGESPKNAIIREAFEEVGIVVKPQTLKLKCVLFRYISKSEERVDFIFETKEWDNIPKNKEPNKASQVLWVDEKNLPDNTIDFIKEVIISSKSYLEIGY